MDNLKLRGKMWYSDIRIGGKRIQKALSKFKPEARRLVGEMLALRRAKKLGIPSNMSWAFFKERYMQFSKSEKQPSTSYKDGLTFRMVDEVDDIERLEDMTPDRMQTIKTKWQEAGYTLSMVTRHIKALKTAMRQAEDWKYIPIQNWRTVKVTEPVGRIDWYDGPALDRLLDLLEDPWQRSAVLMSRMGLRSGEVYWLEWSDIQFDNRRIFFTSKPHYGWKIKSDKKGKMKRMIPLDTAPEIEAYLKSIRRPSGFVLGEDRPKDLLLFYRKMNKAIKKVAVKTHSNKRGTPHILRHTFASHLVQAGVPLEVVRDLMGHTSIKMTEVYAHLAPANLSAGMKLLPKSRASVLSPLKSRGESPTVIDSHTLIDGEFAKGPMFDGN